MGKALDRFYTAGGVGPNEWGALGFNVGSLTGGNTQGTLADYAFVPDNLTHIGQVKLGWELSERQNLYAIAHAGNTHNNYRKTDRNFYGWDLRYMDRSVENFDTTVYAKMYSEKNEFPGFLRYDELGPPRTRAGFVTGHAPSDIVDSAMFQPPDPERGHVPWPSTQNPTDPDNPFIRWRWSGENGFVLHPWDYTRTSAGFQTRWQPLESYTGLSLIGGYDYTNWDRDRAVFEGTLVDNPDNPDPDGAEYVDSLNTFNSNSALWPDMGDFSRVEVQTWRLTAGLDYALFGRVPTYLRYMYFDYEDDSAPFNSGELHAILLGASYIF